MGAIYCLFSTEEAAPRYVGQTMQHPRDRYLQHIRDAELGSDVPVHFWMRRIYLRGYDVRHHVIEDRVPEIFLSPNENYWISRFPRLLNERRDYFRRSDTSQTSADEVLRQCRRKISGINENYNGYHGITYHHHQDAYTVRVMRANRNGLFIRYFVRGDELAGWSQRSWPYWFTDFALAIKARSRERAILNRNWRWGRQGPDNKPWRWPKDDLS